MGIFVVKISAQKAINITKGKNMSKGTETKTNQPNSVKVSVVVPIYNVERFLCQAVDSILNQTLKDIEVILVDDGSPDNCGKICEEYAKKDSRVRVIHQKNGGLGNAYNNGIALASGEYIGFVEPDDWIEPEMYEIMYNNAKKYKKLFKLNFLPLRVTKKKKN